MRTQPFLDPSKTEDRIHATLKYCEAKCREQNARRGEQAVLWSHYIFGTPHPHDYNIPINRWDSTP